MNVLCVLFMNVSVSFSCKNTQKVRYVCHCRLLIVCLVKIDIVLVLMYKSGFYSAAIIIVIIVFYNNIYYNK